MYLEGGKIYHLSRQHGRRYQSIRDHQFSFVSEVVEVQERLLQCFHDPDHHLVTSLGWNHRRHPNKWDHCLVHMRSNYLHIFTDVGIDLAGSSQLRLCRGQREQLGRRPDCLNSYQG